MKDFVLCILFLCFGWMASAQTIEFSDTPLQQAIKSIERKTKLSFNYNPDFLKGESVSGKFNFKNKAKALNRIFIQTRLNADIEEDNILISKKEKRTFTICGTGKSKNFNTPLRWMNVYVKEYAKGVQANADGYFEWSVEAYGNEMVRISYLGCDPIYRRLENLDKSLDCKVYYLKESAQLDNLNIVIKDYILPGVNEGSHYSSLALDYAKLKSKHPDPEKDILKVIQQLPGITSVNENAAELNIRGSTPDENLVLWEGSRLFAPGHMFGAISAINPYLIRDIDIYKSMHLPEHANVIGGIVNFELIDSIPKRINGGIGSDLTMFNGNIAVPLSDNIGLVAGGRSSYSGLFSTATLNNYANKTFQTILVNQNNEEDDDEMDEMNIRFNDLNAKLIFIPSRNSKLTFSALTMNNQFTVESEFKKEDLLLSDRINVESFALGAKYEQFINPEQFIRLSYNYSDYNNIQNASLFESEVEDSLISESIISNTISEHTFGVHHSWKINDELQLKSNYHLEQKTVASETDERFQDGSDFFENEELSGFFQNASVNLSWYKNKSIIDFGFKSTYYHEINQWYHSPRIQIQHQLNNTIKLKASAGRLYQFVSQFTQFNLEGFSRNESIWFLHQEEDADALSANKFTTGFIFKKENWLIDIEGYVHHRAGLNAINNLSMPGDFFESEGTGRIQGIDFLIQNQWRNSTSWLNYTLSKNIVDFPNLYEDPVFASNDQTHNLSINNSLSFGKWKTLIAYNYRSSLPFSKPDGVESLPSDEPGINDFEIVYDEINDQRLKDYHRLDAGIYFRSKTFNDRFFIEADAMLINVLNNDNLGQRNHFLDIDDDDDNNQNRPPRIIRLDKRLIERTPQISIRINF